MEVVMCSGVMALAAVPASVYYHGPYGIVISLVWGFAGATVGALCFAFGYTLRNGAYKRKGGFGPDFGGLNVFLLAGMFGIATLVLETWMASLASNDMGQRIMFMSKANAAVGIVAALGGLATGP